MNSKVLPSATLREHLFNVFMDSIDRWVSGAEPTPGFNEFKGAPFGYAQGTPVQCFYGFHRSVGERSRTPPPLISTEFP
jgi:hypothetical protein